MEIWFPKNNAILRLLLKFIEADLSCTINHKCYTKILGINP